MSRRLIFSAVALAGSSVVMYTIYLHRTLSSKIKHRAGIGLVNVEDESDTKIESLPPELANPSRFHIIHDVASKSVPSARLPRYADPDHLLTKYLRRTMSYFTRFPQALLLRLVFKSAEAKRTFDPSFIQTMDFVPEDIVCGTYRVEIRTPNKVEFAMIRPEGLPPIDGRLVISIQPKGDQTLFVSETMQWRRQEENVVLPLEMKSMKWLHELASWWLIESGSQWLCDLQEES
ncbi:uncharacterized protein Z518_08318 [Rhinocladiella mackenziei CBS 650.93]|uniref:Uncharacterized protein n=1 Tax=Rhinocladiella mackenziei CBS 650.93 TaxID=1442369 RepID=A0A0D2FK75_9EURO|nr:uncharacterized protein Z518_08318 [Rhinocladiella mackenziei CBS 650.93]KIX02377.1 hypothetical protein Z518_08318 [Rhinocladiella mackenziei CBS 650.93]